MGSLRGETLTLKSRKETVTVNGSRAHSLDLVETEVQTMSCATTLPATVTVCQFTFREGTIYHRSWKLIPGCNMAPKIMSCSLSIMTRARRRTRSDSGAMAYSSSSMQQTQMAKGIGIPGRWETIWSTCERLTDCVSDPWEPRYLILVGLVYIARSS